jgi:hypothetical protein
MAASKNYKYEIPPELTSVLPRAEGLPDATSTYWFACCVARCLPRGAPMRPLARTRPRGGRRAAWCRTHAALLSARREVVDKPGAYQVRGAKYLDDKIKIPSRVSAMEVVAMRFTFEMDPSFQVSADPDEVVMKQQLDGTERPFLFITNFVMPGVGNWVTYFARRRTEEADPVFEKLLENFIEGDDEYRNKRFKIIPGIPEGSYMVKMAVGNKPAILGTKLTTQYHKGPNCFEVAVDVQSSTIAIGLLRLVTGYASSLDLELAFLIESQSPDELPERLLGGVRARQPMLVPPWDQEQ